MRALALVALLLAGRAAPMTLDGRAPRVISVSAVGRVSVRPDTALVQVGAEARAPVLADATADVDRRMRDVLARVKALAHEYAADKILVNTICLGFVKSAQWERRARGGDMEAYYREAAKAVPLGRVGEAAEFADLVAFLTSARAGYITGTAINFDGGRSAAV